MSNSRSYFFLCHNPTFRAAFRHFDKDQSGHLSREELHNYLCRCNCGEPLSKEEFEAVIDDMDQDGDGKINLKGEDLTLRKIAIWLSKNCPKLDI